MVVEITMKIITKVSPPEALLPSLQLIKLRTDNDDNSKLFKITVEQVGVMPTTSVNNRVQMEAKTTVHGAKNVLPICHPVRP